MGIQIYSNGNTNSIILTTRILNTIYIHSLYLVNVLCKIESKKYCTVGTVATSNRKSQKECKSIPLTHIYMLVCTSISIKGARVN